MINPNKIANRLVIYQSPPRAWLRSDVWRSQLSRDTRRSVIAISLSIESYRQVIMRAMAAAVDDQIVNGEASH
jgi:hypothetical protein